MNKLNYFLAMMIFTILSNEALAASFKKLSLERVGTNMHNFAIKAVVSVAAGTIALIAIFGKLKIIDAPMMHIKEHYKLAAIALTGGGVLALISAWAK